MRATWSWTVPLLCSLVVAGEYGQNAATYEGLEGGSMTEVKLDLMEYFAGFAATAHCNNDVALSDLHDYGSKQHRKESEGYDIEGELYGRSENGRDYSDHHRSLPTLVTSVSGGALGTHVELSVEDDEQVIVATFTSDTDTESWMSRPDHPMAPCDDLFPGCAVNAEMLVALQGVHDTLLKLLRDARTTRPDYMVIFTGWSLGGSLATLAAGYAQARIGLPVYTFTYGSPPPGNEVFARALDRHQSMHLRVAHEGDSVPCVLSPALGYRHVGRRYMIVKDPFDRSQYELEDVVSERGGEGDGDVCQAWDRSDEAHYQYFSITKDCSTFGL